MKVHLITSRPTLEQDISTLQKIIKIIRDQGHELADGWIQEAYKRNVDPDKVIPDWGTIFKTNLEVVNKSDVIIAETSHENFGVGYQIAYAVQQKKPVLLLRHQTADKDAFVTGVEDGWVVREEYTDESLPKILKKFLDDNDIQAKDMRFNFFIDRKIYNYLRWASFKTGETKAQILRELVEREIDKVNDNKV